MIDSTTNGVPRRRWLDWQPDEKIMGDSAGTEPTKPSEPGFDGFDGSTSAKSAKIATPPSETQELPVPVRRRLKSIASAVDCSTESERVMSWADWKAATLNQLFLELGNTGHSGRITADTIRHGEQVWMTRSKNRDAESQKSMRPA